MLLAPRRLDVRAWFTLAVSVPLAGLALAATATHEGVAKTAGLWVPVMLAPAVILAVKSLEVRERADRRGLDGALLASLILSIVEAASLLLTVALGAPLSGQEIACGLAVSAFPLALTVPAALLRPAFPPLLLPGTLELKAASLAQALKQPYAGGRQGPVEWAEYKRLEEVAGEVEAGADVAGPQPALGGEQEAGERQQAVLVRFPRLAADRPAGPRADIDQVVDHPARGALGQVQSIADFLQQARLEANEDGRPDLRLLEGGAQGLEGQERPRMWLAFRKGAQGDGGGGGDAGQGQGVVEQGGRPLPDRFERCRAELFGDPRAVADGGPRPGLEEGLQPPRPPARDVGGIAAVMGRQQVDDRPALPMGSGGQNEGVVDEFHPIKLWVPAQEIQSDLEDTQAEHDEALEQLKDLLTIYRAEVVAKRAMPPLRRAVG